MNGRHRLARALVSTAAATILAAACGTGVSRPSSSVSPCFRALPVADGAAAHGKLVQIRRMNAAHANAALARLAPGHAPLTATGSMCVVVYDAGSHPPTMVTTGMVGRYVLVVVEERHLTVAGVAVVDHLPARRRLVRR